MLVGTAVGAGAWLGGTADARGFMYPYPPSDAPVPNFFAEKFRFAFVEGGDDASSAAVLMSTAVRRDGVLGNWPKRLIFETWAVR